MMCAASVLNMRGGRRTKKHGAANRLNVGKAAMSACYSHVDDRYDTNVVSTPWSLIATPAMGPPGPGGLDTALERAFGVHVTGRAPIEVKGKGLLEMFWVDAVVDAAEAAEGSPGFSAQTAPRTISPPHLSLEGGMGAERVAPGPGRSPGPFPSAWGATLGQSPTTDIVTTPGGGGGRERASTLIGMNRAANESFRIRATQTRELGAQRSVIPARRPSAIGEATPAFAVSPVPRRPRRVRPVIVTRSQSRVAAVGQFATWAASEIVRIARASDSRVAVPGAIAELVVEADDINLHQVLVTSDMYKRVRARRAAPRFECCVPLFKISNAYCYKCSHMILSRRRCRSGCSNSTMLPSNQSRSWRRALSCGTCNPLSCANRSILSGDLVRCMNARSS